MIRIKSKEFTFKSVCKNEGCDDKPKQTIDDLTEEDWKDIAAPLTSEMSPEELAMYFDKKYDLNLPEEFFEEKKESTEDKPKETDEAKEETPEEFARRLAKKYGIDLGDE